MPASSSHIEIANAPQIQSPTTASIASSNLQSTSPTIPQQNTNATNQNTLDASTPPPTTSLDASTDALNADSGGTGGTSKDNNNSTVATPVPSSKPTSNENLKFFTTNTEIKTRAEPPEALAPACVYAEQALSDYDLRSKLFLDFAEKTEASVVLEKALANSHSLLQLCKDLNQESSFESVEELFEELHIEEGAFYVLNQLFVVVLVFFLLFNLNFLSIYWLVFLCFSYLRFFDFQVFRFCLKFVGTTSILSKP